MIASIVFTSERCSKCAFSTEQSIEWFDISSDPLFDMNMSSKKEIDNVVIYADHKACTLCNIMYRTNACIFILIPDIDVT